MSLSHHNHSWLPPGNLRPPDDYHDVRSTNGYISNSFADSRTPQTRPAASADGSYTENLISEADTTIAEEDPRVAMFRDLYRRSEANINILFSNKDNSETDNNAVGDTTVANVEHLRDSGGVRTRTDIPSSRPFSLKKPARKLDDDDYDEYDDDDNDNDDDNGNADAAAPADTAVSPLKTKSAAPSLDLTAIPSSGHRPSIATSVTADNAKGPKKETFEEIRNKLEQDKKTTEDSAKRSFHTLFYTLENDRDAMLDQRRLDESERQVEAEMSGQANSGSNNDNAGSNSFGSLSSANLGASSLTLKNLIARIDMKRTMVQASDAELRSLMSEVRKNRSKWASEDKIGQEELYEAAEKVLSELKAMTEHSTAFLTRVNKRDAPDYYTIIKRPMDLGTMTKKLKALQYKSKQEFVDDINLIWSNCLKYNTDPDHFLRKHALYMRKETEKLVPLIPDITIRDRAEVEAEERRLQLAEFGGGEESDDEPIMSSRGRKAPKKGAPAVRNTPRISEAPSAVPGQTPAPIRAGSDAALEGIQNTSSTTPPPSTHTPSDPTGATADASGSQGDSLENERLAPSNNALSALSAPGLELEDPEYNVWKQVTKKDRAVIAAERHRLLKGNKLASDEPALLRTKAGMRRWLRNQKRATAEGDADHESNSQAAESGAAGETLAEGMKVEEDMTVPDYYDVMSGIPDLPERLLWNEDSEGNVVDTSEEFLRILPKGLFVQPDSKFSRKMDANMRQLQETRKICSKIGIVKQMQLQTQMYQNQFQKYQPEPFVEQDVAPHVLNDGGPVVAPWVCKTALQRSVAKIFYHAGFEECQPSALQVATDVASDFFKKIGETMKSYMEMPKLLATDEQESESSSASQWNPAYTQPEIILHTLSTVGTDVESLESYIRDDVERLGAKFVTIHDRLRSLFAELLRPALGDGGEDGSNSFADGSEQFVVGDFAEDIDEDFFGFKELGLDKELGLATLSVPLHLLQNRMYNAAQSQSTSTAQAVNVFPSPPPYPRMTSETVSSQIGLVQDFFRAKLQARNGEPLVEDLELPPKQRPTATRPRLPASGKIVPPGPSGPTSSPQKRPAPPTLLQAATSSKPGTSEPSKKKFKKNSTVSLDAPGSADGDEAKQSVDGTKTPVTDPMLTNSKSNDASMEGAPVISAPEISSTKSGADSSTMPNAVGVENNNRTDTSNADDHNNPTVNGSAAPMTNGTASGSS